MEYKVLCSIVVFYPKNNATDEKVVSETKTRWGEPVCSHKMMQYAAYNKGQTHRSAPTQWGNSIQYSLTKINAATSLLLLHVFIIFALFNVNKDNHGKTGMD